MIAAFDLGTGAGSVRVGGPRLCLIAGPCVIESADLCVEVAQRMRTLCERAGFGYVFKASFDKANRTSIHSFRGPGLETGLEILRHVGETCGVPTLTDIHLPEQAGPAAAAVDILQIPAFLARQTDLLAAAALTGKPVNVKKAQFMAPWDMAQVVGKLRESDCAGILLTERGTSFGYNALVVDFRGLPQLRALGYPVCFDVTHSLQQPGGLGSQSGATREYAPHLARAAVAVGVDALFMEVHPNPPQAKSDAAAQLSLDDAEALLPVLARLRAAAAAPENELP
jgi:2-dehydro-3-deoxyphosphooctonate aldolase (KDO 8-P synthase)